jgi:GNAT superfamily N-acetyltransferase
MKLRKFIKETIRECLNEQKTIGNVKYKKSVDEDRTKITAFLDNEKVGSISMEILFDAYQYEFDDVFDEDTFEELFPDSEIVKIEHIEVDDKYKNYGIGSELMKRGMKLMKRNGYNQFYLNASPMGFKGLGTMDLVDFYKKFGFKELLNQGHNVLMGVNFDKSLNETMMKKRKELCNNVLCFSRMLAKKKFIAKNDNFKVRVLLKGDGDELERTFDIEVPVMTGLRNDFDSQKEYKDAIEDYKNEASVVGWNLYGEETEWQTIFYSEIEDVVEDLNLKLYR